MSQAATAKHSVELVPGGPVQGSIRPPGSKSLTNRALVCAALASGPSHLTGALASEDTEVMIAALTKLGLQVHASASGTEIHVQPQQLRQSTEELSLFVANSGTTIRFLTAALSVLGGKYYLHGVPRMHQRPILDLVNALRPLGCQVETLSPGGCPPVRIDSRGWQNDQTQVAGSVSSQYLSGLLMAAPAAGRDIQIRILGELVSRPYVEMTTALMRDFGAIVESPDAASFIVRGNAGYQGRQYAIEPDASAASYHWAAAAITGGRVLVEGLFPNSLQGDVAFVNVLQQMGCQVEVTAAGIAVSGRARNGISVDMNSISDCVQTLAVVALFADSPTTIRGVGHNRFKETDRISDLARELRKLGASVEEYDDGLKIVPGPLDGAVLETYHDHRMAMSLSLAGLLVRGVEILNPACTGKTYPHFFADLERLTGRSHLWR